MAINRFPLLPKEIGFNEKLYPTEPVIYKIVNIVNGKVYVGQTTKFRKRLSQHFNALSHNNHCSNYLQKSFNKHGVDSFYFEILETVTKENICEREVYWIEKLDSSNRDKGYNILVNAPSPWYGKRNLLHCLRISEALRGKHHSVETRKKQSLARLGRFAGRESSVSKAVLQYDKNMNFIKEYNSIGEACKLTNINRRSIGYSAAGRYKTAGGFVWKLKRDTPCQA